MKRLRMRVIILATWLILLLSAERFLRLTDFTSGWELFLIAVVILALIARQINRIPLWLIPTIIIPLLIVIITWLGISIGRNALLFAVFRAGAIAITTSLAYWVSLAIHDFETAVSEVMIVPHEGISEFAGIEPGCFYREVRRARNHQRPLALMAVAIDEKSIDFVMDRIIKEAQSAFMKQFALTGVAKTLCENLEDSSIVAQTHDYLLVALPEAKVDEIPGLIARLREQVSAQVGVDLRIGSASLPEDSFTFEGLVNKATREMNISLEPQPYIELEHLSIGHPTPR